MPKKEDDIAVDPVVQAVHKEYEQLLTHFMSNVSHTLKRYKDLLEAALPHNPKGEQFVMSTGNAVGDEGSRKSERRGPSAEPTAEAPSSPLLQRQKLDPAEVATMEASASVFLRQHSAVLAKLPEAGLPPVTATTTTARDSASKEPSPVIIAADPSPKDKPMTPKVTKEQLETVALPLLLLSQMRILKREARDLGKTLDQMHDWIAMNVPVMKDEDNLGVAVMASVITEMAGAISRVRNVYEIESSYLSDRSELELKYIKHSDADSALRALQVADNDAWDTLEKGWRVLIRIVLVVHSTLAKNMRLLKDPRSGPKHNLAL